jgi:hypothetical protein
VALAELQKEIVTRVQHTGRTLLAATRFGDWAYQTIKDCAFFDVTEFALTESFGMLGRYYRDNFTLAIDAFQRFDQNFSESIDSPTTGDGSLIQLLGIDQLLDLGEDISQLSINETAALAVQFLTCDYAAAMACPINDGLVRRTKLVLLLTVGAYAVFALVFPPFTMIPIIVAVSAGPILMYATYRVSPFCFPILPTAFPNDVLDVFAQLRPIQGGAFIADTFAALNASGSEGPFDVCRRIGFTSPLDNAAFTLTASGYPPPALEILGYPFLRDYRPFAQDRAYATCNYLTMTRSVAWVMTGYAAFPLATATVLASIAVVLSVISALLTGGTMVLAVRGVNDELPPLLNRKSVKLSQTATPSRPLITGMSQLMQRRRVVHAP